jgi:uncharacterized damage-inducible protein DinB
MEEHTMVQAIRRLWDHLAWADDRLLKALEAGPPPPAETLREYAHILGAGETWLARLEGRPATTPVWPRMELPELRRFAGELHAAYSRSLAALDAERLQSEAAYTTTDGSAYSTPVQDILLQVALHAQYHRGKVNLLLRQAGLAPAATDYITFVRSAPAAGTAVTQPKPGVG